MASTFQREAAEGPLLIADIGGYTSFLQAVGEAHKDDALANGAVPEAYGLMSSLLDGIVEQIAPPFTVAKLEGDAVFAFVATGAAVLRGEALLGCIEVATPRSARGSPRLVRSGAAPATPAAAPTSSI